MIECDFEMGLALKDTQARDARDRMAADDVQVEVEDLLNDAGYATQACTNGWVRVYVDGCGVAGMDTVADAEAWLATQTRLAR